MHFIMPRFFVNCERWKWNDDLRIYVSTHGHVKDEYKKNIAAKINSKGYFVVYIKMCIFAQYTQEKNGLFHFFCGQNAFLRLFYCCFR